MVLFENNNNHNNMASTVVSNGHLLDEFCSVKGEIVQKNGLVYTCALNQTELKINQNKFYIMQLVKNGNNYHLHKRWGRTGETGRVTPDNYGNEFTAINAFEKQFRSKTGNSWGTKNFEKKEGKYFLLEVSYEEELSKVNPEKTGDIPTSQLDTRVQDLIKMISDVQMMQNTMVQLDIDTKKMPLGKIKQSQLDKAKEILNDINQLVSRIENYEDSDDSMELDDLKSSLMNLSSKYYTYVPYACGRRKPPLIENNEMVGKYRDTIDELANIAIGVNIVNNVKKDENPIDAIYKDIHTEIKALDRENKMWAEIEKYVANTHGSTHHVKLEIIDIYEINQMGKATKFNEYTKNIGNTTLLIHGSSLSNWISILKNDLSINPEKFTTTITGKMFGGNSVYWANCFSKSYGYTRASSTNNIACFALGEVALGKVSKRHQADYYVTKASLNKEGCHSIHGVGKTTPATMTEVDGVKIPNGSLKPSRENSVLLYDEFVIYDSNQFKIKYLVITKNVL